MPRVVRRAGRRLRRLAGRLGRGEDGQILLLGVWMIGVVAALVGGGAGATAVYLFLKTLTSLADSAAAAAAGGVDEDGYFGGAEADGAPGRLTDAVVRAAALEDLAAQPERPESVQVTLAASPDGATAVVTLTARSRPPFLPWGVIPSRGFVITATGSARTTTAP